MRHLPYDVARCKPSYVSCVNKGTCARFTSPGNPNGQQPSSDFSILIVADRCVMHESNEQKQEEPHA